ncbi:hypothetical protein M5689_005598 [Euphorbia peplus]|nr:hypothetical protein M5689_005598 [Euphorbia peplus]
MGSSRGLVCLASSKATATTSLKSYVFIWNPFTRHLKKIPFWWPLHSKGTDYLHGFSYDPVANDFVLVISTHCGAFFYFSFKENCWTEISSGTYFNPLSIPKPWMNRPVMTHSTELNQVLHWIVTPDHVYNYHYPEIRIMSFDLAKREGKKGVKVPAFVSSFRTSGCAGLFEHEGCLCLYFSRNNRSKEIWIMEKYGDNESWARLLTIENSESLLSGFEFCHAAIVCITTRNEVVLHSDGKLIKYSSKEGKFDEANLVQQYVNSACSYVDTLVSPNHIYQC